jgi:hypothetical protein
MLQVRMSAALEGLSSTLDDDWEGRLVPRLPFPVAYVLGRLRAGGYPWDILVKDLVSAVIRYLAVVGVSDYLHSAEQADFDLNERLQKLGQPMIEGNWLAIVNGCAARSTACGVPQYAEAVRAVECGSMTVALEDSRSGLRTERLGLLSALLKIRNALYAHGASLTEEEKTHARPLILTLVRAVLHVLDPVWQCDFLAATTPGGRQAVLLKGIEGFPVLDDILPARCALRLPGGRILPLEPLAFSEADGNRSERGLLDAQGELYVLNQLNRRRVPEYTGVAGGHVERPDLASGVSDLFGARRVWERRVDVELDSVLDYARRKAAARLAELEDEGLFDPVRFVRREAVRAELDRFMESPDRRALFVAGASGSGKSTAIFDWARDKVLLGAPVLLLRASELPPDAVKPRRWRDHVSAELGTVRTIEEVLDRAATAPSRRFVIVIDGLNEFTAAGRDASLLFRSINQLLSDCRAKTSLKLVVTARTDGLGQFLPNGRLPGDAEEDAWTEVGGKPCLEVPPLTPEEGIALLAAFGIEASRARSLVEVAQPLSPDVLRKAALGALDADDLRRMDDRGITTSVLDSRLGRDKALRSVVDELVQVMGRKRDLALEEAELEKAAPRLYKRLRADGDRLLTTLRELGIVQVVARTREGGAERTWALALSHDSLFDALGARQRRRRLRWRLVFTAAVVAFAFVALGLGALGLVEGALTAKVAELRRAVQSSCAAYAGETIASATRGRFIAACTDVEAAAVVSGEAVGKTVVGMLRNMVLTVLGAVLVLLWSSDLYGHWREGKDRRDMRVLFFGREDDLRSSRDLLVAVVPVAVVAMAWTLVRFKELLGPGDAPFAELLSAVAPLLALLVLLIVLGMPLLAILGYRRASRGSPLLWESRYAETGITQTRRSIAHLSVLLTIAFGGLAALMGLRGSIFEPERPLREGYAAIEGLNRRADWQALGDWAPAKRILSGEALKTAAADARGKLDKALVPADDPDRPYLLAGLAGFWAATLLFMWTSILGVQYVARRRGARAPERRDAVV